MKDAILILSLILLPAWPAYADWIQVDEAPSTGLTVYVNPFTVLHKGDSVILWYLFDWKKDPNREGGQILSDKTEAEFDCKEERSRHLVTWFFRDNMGRGASLGSSSAFREWQPVTPDSISQTLWQFACKKKLSRR